MQTSQQHKQRRHGRGTPMRKAFEQVGLQLSRCSLCTLGKALGRSWLLLASVTWPGRTKCGTLARRNAVLACPVQPSPLCKCATLRPQPGRRAGSRPSSATAWWRRCSSSPSSSREFASGQRALAVVFIQITCWQVGCRRLIIHSISQRVEAGTALSSIAA